MRERCKEGVIEKIGKIVKQGERERESNGEKWRIILERRSTKKGMRMVEGRVMVRFGK